MKPNLPEELLKSEKGERKMNCQTGQSKKKKKRDALLQQRANGNDVLTRSFRGSLPSTPTTKPDHDFSQIHQMIQSSLTGATHAKQIWALWLKQCSVLDRHGAR